MLCELHIENLALIDSLSLLFDAHSESNLIIMTGETGAGKSIMLRALDLLGGSRASADWIRTGKESCTVEACFEFGPQHEQLLARLEEEGLRDGNTVIIRRSIFLNGRSKLYVNGLMVTSKQLGDLTSQMLNVAGQHEHQQLLQPGLHLDFLDIFGDLWPLRQQLADVFQEWKGVLHALQDLRRAEKDKDARRELLAFQVQEIQAAAITPGEDETLVAEKQRLKNADILLQLTQESLYLLSNEIFELMTSLRRNMEQIAGLDPEAAVLAENLSGYAFQGEDYVAQLRKYRDMLNNDPYRLEQVAERLDLLQQLKRKYGKTLDEVVEYAASAAQELEALENMEQEIVRLEQQELQLQHTLCQLGESLSEKRHECARQMEVAMVAELASLSFHQAHFEVRWQSVEHQPLTMKESGWDRVEFFFAPNPGEMAKPLSRVASGGELSRLMLAMKCLFARKDLIDTVIFDEVDAGIGGEAAESVARKIKELAGHHQVICITHLPQIAARGDHHYCVTKVVEQGRTQSRVVKLTEEDRVQELARMLAGESVTSQTRAWAQELLARGRTAA